VSTPVRRALYGRLAGDTTLNGLLAAPAAGYSKAIYHDQAPAGAGFPFVVFGKQSGVPTEAMGDPSALENDVWLVKAVDRSTSADTAEAIQARVASTLNDASLSISGATHLYLRRQSDVEYPEVTDGVTYRHAGSLYRLVTTD
jgi:uncharacterized protein DUF3168